ncbi:MAG: hypothetical protein C5B58_01725 [Acidobacteria bacterium]|nr:MAG: hypothetical protein C5B58_01725 [Acidobacteriota bacterium]
MQFVAVENLECEREDAMSRPAVSNSLVAFVLAVGLTAPTCMAAPLATAGSAEAEFAKIPTWSVPPASAVRAAMLNWLSTRRLDESIRKQAEETWRDVTDAPPDADRLSPVVTTIALADPQTRELLDLTAKPKSPGPLPRFAFLTNNQIPAFERNNLRLWYGRWLARQRLYDDSLAQLSGLEPSDVVDPASLLFFQATDNQWLLQKEPGLKTLSRLLERKIELPRRYAQTAVLMQSDLAALNEESLEHIGRRMRDTGIRLALGHAGKKVRSVEDGIIASLDKMIGDEGPDAGLFCPLADPSGDRRSSGPAPDSALLKGVGPGEVAKKSNGAHTDWGNLNPKERQEVLQSIGRDYPSHYRDVIEQYFKRLAADQATDK